MSLRGKKPEHVNKRLKAFFYGAAGVGKTTAAISFPNPYVIDTERGCENDQYIEILSANGGALFQTSDFREIFNEVKALMTEKHSYKTLVIDSLSIIYSNLVSEAEIRVGSTFGKNYNEANKKMKHLINYLLRLDMNVIITSHSKNDYGDSMQVIGSTFDCYKKLDYLFDLVIEIVQKGKERIALIKKSRIKEFSETESFVFSYEEICKRYNKNNIEKEVEPSVLVQPIQLEELKEIIKEMEIPLENVEIWLEKCQSQSLEDLKESDALKIISYLKSKK